MRTGMRSRAMWWVLTPAVDTHFGAVGRCSPVHTPSASCKYRVGVIEPIVTLRSLTLCARAYLQKQQALLGQMLLEGYGCDRDPAAGREWVDKAKRRGYRMEGVYCEL